MGRPEPYQEAVDTYASEPLFKEAARYCKVFGQDIETVLAKTPVEFTRAQAALKVIGDDYEQAAKGG